MHPKATQTSIARDLELSQALVSKVLNGGRERVDPETYDRIWNHAIKVGYAGKGLRLAGSPEQLGPRQVGVILRAGIRLATQSNFFNHVQHGLHEALQSQGVATTFLGSEDSLSSAMIEKLLHGSRPGLGVAILGEVQPRFLRMVRAISPRVVAVSSSFQGLCCTINSNEQQSLDLLVDHLVQLGHRRFAWINGEPGYGRYLARQNALRAALAQHDLELKAERCIAVAGAGGRQEGCRAALDQLARMTREKDRCTALVAANGPLARGAINGLLREGWKVPEDFSVVAVDDTRVCTEEEPAITRAAANPELLGAAAAEALLDSTGDAGERLSEILLPAKFHLGASSGPASQSVSMGSARKRRAG